jgi:transposase
LAGLHDRPRGRPRRRLDAKEEAALAAAIERGPDPDADGCCAWTRADPCRWLEAEYGKAYHPSSMSRVLRRLGCAHHGDPTTDSMNIRPGIPRPSDHPRSSGIRPG